MAASCQLQRRSAPRSQVGLLTPTYAGGDSGAAAAGLAPVHLGGGSAAHLGAVGLLVHGAVLVHALLRGVLPLQRLSHLRLEVVVGALLVGHGRLLVEVRYVRTLPPSHAEPDGASEKAGQRLASYFFSSSRMRWSSRCSAGSSTSATTSIISATCLLSWRFS